MSKLTASSAESSSERRGAVMDIPHPRRLSYYYGIPIRTYKIVLGKAAPLTFGSRKPRTQRCISEGNIKYSIGRLTYEHDTYTWTHAAKSLPKVTVKFAERLSPLRGPIQERIIFLLQYNIPSSAVRHFGGIHIYMAGTCFSLHEVHSYSSSEFR